MVFRCQEWLLLAVVIAIALLVRVIMVPATERVYYDEHTYLQLARGIAAEGRARVASYGLVGEKFYRCEIGSYPHWPSSWPTLLAGVMMLTGYARWTGRLVNIILSLMTIVLLALIAGVLFPGTYIWLAVSAIYAFLPANQVWSSTSASEVFAVFAATLSVLCAVRFAQTSSRRLGYLLAASLATAAQVRNETIIMVSVCGLIIYALGGRKALKTIYLPATVLLLILLPQGLHLGCISRNYDPNLMIGTGFGFRFLASNAVSVAQYLYQEPVSIVCLGLAILGTLKLYKEKITLPLWVWGLSIFLIPMFYFGGSYMFPGGERFVLGWLPAACLLGGVGLYALHLTLTHFVHKKLLILAWIGTFLFALFLAEPHAASEDKKTCLPRDDCTFLREVLHLIPNDSIVISADPPAVIAEGHSAVLITWLDTKLDRIQNLTARFPNKIFLFIAPSSTPAQWPEGAECLHLLFSVFKAKVVRSQRISGGEQQVLYQLLYQGRK